MVRYACGELSYDLTFGLLFSQASISDSSQPTVLLEICFLNGNSPAFSILQRVDLVTDKISHNWLGLIIFIIILYYGLVYVIA